MNMPSNSSTANIAKSMKTGSRSKPVAQLISPREAPENAISWLNVAEPKTIR